MDGNRPNLRPPPLPTGACNKCGMQIMKQALEQHKRTCDGKGKYFLCRACLKRYFTRKRALACCAASASTKLPPRQSVQKFFKCEICEKEYTTKSTAEYCCSDEKEGKDEESMERTWGISDNELAQLTKWQDAHNANEDWQMVYQDALRSGDLDCTYCEKTFSTTGSFQKHFYSCHINIHPVRCEICRKLFKNTVDRKQHMNNWHTEVKKCEMCDKKYPEGRLRFHMKQEHARTPPKETPEVMRTCDVCDEVFESRGKMFAHRRKIHPDAGSASVVCDICEEECSDHIRLRIHKNRKHGRRQKICDKEGNYKIPCYVCNKLIGVHYLDAHIGRMHDPLLSEVRGKKKVCPICTESLPDLYFAFHMKKHTVCEYKCAGCDMKFSSSADCASHISTAHVTAVD